jgi:ribonucleotide monophosphatase NagD (HAD superfamily)
VGKPALPFFRTALERLNVSAAQAAMIGDDLNTDVGGAQAAGIPGILVRTGKFRGEDESGEVVPHAVLESIAELPRWWQEQA